MKIMKPNTRSFTEKKNDLHVSQNCAQTDVSKFILQTCDRGNADIIFIAYILVMFCIGLLIRLHFNLFE